MQEASVLEGPPRLEVGPRMLGLFPVRLWVEDLRVKLVCKAPLVKLFQDCHLLAQMWPSQGI